MLLSDLLVYASPSFDPYSSLSSLLLFLSPEPSIGSHIIGVGYVSVELNPNLIDDRIRFGFKEQKPPKW